MSDITVFTARKILTMEPSCPEATAVAVRDGKIIEVGSLETLKPWLDAHSHVIDDQFKDHVLMPGFIDPHLHPTMAAFILQMEFVTALDWRLPWGTVRAVKTQEAFLARVAELDASIEDPQAPLFTWGYHRSWHGNLTLRDLDAISTSRPIILWHRSFHEIIVNSAALAWMELDQAKIPNDAQVKLADGHFYEMGLHLAQQKIVPHLLQPERYKLGLDRLRRVVHFGGHTTIGDMAVGIFGAEMEIAAAIAAFENEDTPFRVDMIADGNSLSARTKDHAEALKTVEKFPENNTHRIRFSDHVKLFTDGAFFSQLMMLQDPGYIDGHHGEWLMVPENFEAAARTYWNAGYKIHVHCTGDLGLELALDVLEKLQAEHPRFDHRYTIEHFGISTPEQVRRLAVLGGCISANIYYLHELGQQYAQNGVGYERSSQMVRLGTAMRHGVPVALHSDYTMAPALPLNSAWVAVNRLTESGEVLGPEERLSVDQALRAITVEAAYVLGREHEIGTIRAGKKADFTVLEADPYAVPELELRDIAIWGTIFEGRPYPIQD